MPRRRSGSLLTIAFAAALVATAQGGVASAQDGRPSLADNFPHAFERVPGPSWAIQPCARAIRDGRVICTDSDTGRTFSSATNASESRWDPWPPRPGASTPPNATPAPPPAVMPTPETPAPLPSATTTAPTPRVRNAYDEWRDTGPREQERERREQEARDERRREQDLLDDHRRTERAQSERAAAKRRVEETLADQAAGKRTGNGDASMRGRDTAAR
jgi:hypothetical protein